MKRMGQELEQWGRWVRRDKMVMGYCSQMLTLLMQNTPAPAREVIAITDERAVEIDQAVARLISRDKEMGLALATYFIKGRDYRGTADLMRDLHGFPSSKDTVRLMVLAGTCWIDGVLSGELKLAA